MARKFKLQNDISVISSMQFKAFLARKFKSIKVSKHFIHFRRESSNIKIFKDFGAKIQITFLGICTQFSKPFSFFIHMGIIMVLQVGWTSVTFFWWYTVSQTEMITSHKNNLCTLAHCDRTSILVQKVKMIEKFRCLFIFRTKFSCLFTFWIKFSCLFTFWTRFSCLFTFICKTL